MSQIANRLAKAQLQLDIYRCLQEKGGPRTRNGSLFSRGAPVDQRDTPNISPADFNIFAEDDTIEAEAAQKERASSTVCKLLDLDFDLAFRALHTLGVDSSEAYATAATDMAQAGKSAALQKLLANIQGTVSDEQWDQVVGSAALASPAEAGKSFLLGSLWKSPAEQLVDMMRSTHSQVVTLVKLDLLEKAANIAITSGSVVNVRVVEAEAVRQRNEAVLGACVAFLHSHS